MERVHLDFLGPLPRTERGNEYCLVMVDQFTKWVECIPLPSQTAEITAQATVNDCLQGLDILSQYLRTKEETLKANFLQPYVNSYKYIK